ncbi:ATP-binding protein [Streptomyces sp. NPDC006458]|uniref:ATP-binding protein n=1 Tax=Streptomyces sp. NPDC006458 TaxID=3154302 RepID=UPI0033A3FFA0
MNQQSAAPEAEVVTPVRNLSLCLSATPRGARLARLLTVDRLRAWGLPSDPAAHIVAELAANAVTHGRVRGRGFGLTVHVVGETLRVEVTDTRGDCLPSPQHPSEEGESGRGLLLVEALADRWGVSQGPSPRKTVWAEIELFAPEPISASPGDVSRLSSQEPER